MAEQKTTQEVEAIKSQDDMWNLVCKKRFETNEQKDEKRDELIREIHGKVTNGFGAGIEAVDRKVETLKTDTNKRIDELKQDMDSRFDKTDRAIQEVKKSANAALIAIISAVIAAGGTLLAAILTGFFGILEKLGG